MEKVVEFTNDTCDGIANAATGAFSDWSHAEQTIAKVAVAGALAYGVNRACLAKGAVGFAVREALPVIGVSGTADLLRHAGTARNGHDVGELAFDLLLTTAASQAAGTFAFPRTQISLDQCRSNVHPNAKTAQAFERTSRSAFFDSVEERVRFPQLQGLQKADVVVVGGGIGGILTANELAGAGYKCTLLESNHLAGATTGNGASMLTRVPDLEYAVLRQLYGDELCAKYILALKRGHSQMTRLAESIPCDYQKYDSHKISYTPNNEHLRHEFDSLKLADPDATFLTGPEASALFAPAQSAMVLHGEGSLNPRKLSMALASSGNFQVYENSRVTGIRIGHPAKPVEVITEHGKIKADKVVFATGAPAPMFDHLNEHIAPIQCFASIARAPNRLPGNFFDDRDPDFSYFRNFGDGKVFFGGVARFPSDTVTAIETNPALGERLQALFPGAKIEKQWTGTIFSSVHDGLPIVEPHPLHSRVFNITALGGIGLVNGQTAAAELRQVLTNKSAETLFSSRRFAGNHTP